MALIPLNQTTAVDVDELEFDYINPRLALQMVDFEEGQKPDLIQFIKFLDREADLGELVTSILQNGYIPVEPLIVIHENNIHENRKYRVLEGNRRLAAIRLIKEKSFKESFREEVSIPVDEEKITEDIRKTLNEIPVFRVEKAAHAEALIGFKHIKGAYKWNSFSKAKYVTKQYCAGRNIDDIARAIGDENATVRNLISGMLVLEQAIEAGVFNISDRNKPGSFGFSHLYTALGRSEYQEFLGLESGWAKAPAHTPISADKLDQLGEVLSYIYGSKKADKVALVRSQNPDLGRLGKVITCDDGLDELRAGSDLTAAWELLRPDQQVFDSVIRSALAAVNKANATMTRYDGKNENAVDIVEKILRGAESLEATVRIRRQKYIKNTKQSPPE